MCPISVKFRSPKLFKTFRTLVWHVPDIGQISSTKLFRTFCTPVWHVPDIGQISSTKLFRPPVRHVPDISQISTPKLFNKLKSSLCAQYFLLLSFCPIPEFGQMSIFLINYNLCPCLFFYRWCVCMDHEDFEKLCATAFRIIAAHNRRTATVIVLSVIFAKHWLISPSLG